jgi:hypothetical protein
VCSTVCMNITPAIHGPRVLSYVPLSCCPQVVNLSGNRLSALPPFFSCLRGLQQLVLASTDLLLLPCFISSLACLTHLNLASNKLQVIQRVLTREVQPESVRQSAAGNISRIGLTSHSDCAGFEVFACVGGRVGGWASVGKWVAGWVRVGGRVGGWVGGSGWVGGLVGGSGWVGGWVGGCMQTLNPCAWMGSCQARALGDGVWLCC